MGVVRFNDDTRSQITVDMKTSRDPDGSTLELKIDDVWHDCAWTGTSTEGTDDAGKPQWTQAALTIDFFAGPAVTPAGATVLDIRRHDTETRTTWLDGTVVVEAASPVDVKER